MTMTFPTEVPETRTAAAIWCQMTDRMHLRLHIELSRWQLHNMLHNQIYVSLHDQLREWPCR